MPTRSYYFPTEFSHVEQIIRAESTADRETSFAEFRHLNIAPIFSGYELANILGIGPGLLIGILRNPHQNYRQFPVVKKGGGTRQVSSPRTYLKVIQWWILDNILTHLETPDIVFGFKRGTSINWNARHHLGSRHFLNVDIASFFDSVTEVSVYDLFSRLGYADSVSSVLCQLCCLNGSLPQGAPTSPAIGNQILKPLDNSLCELSSEHGIKYSRYADDLTFSSRDFIAQDFLDAVRLRVAEIGFELKDEKTRWRGPGARTEVTGLVVTDFVQPPLKWRKQCRATLHHLGKKERLEQKDIRYLEGILGYASSFEDARQMQALKATTARLLEEHRFPFTEVDRKNTR
ncbi:Reverse transcriptase (RNA-dependent DNA polymerase) [Rhodobacteraceae bacterium THAF1]|uniref:reverse transcriptase domain-containing protein n=1 Tax=Palleronia sp. THAF1 TaxID=2587842 RepID=UPI000F3D4E6B|nr:reverse transcriptase domain-containing protein [Palleronia sp. THAF1]QFU07181.1 Reverse transcriptase (RNA-dependent DNA polymerase) [Palleronia sp. THAF1]VDC19973.1 Reverse transcriptase (RNA-dependent DNA polymerase) [Rhodobacteraceae bacterium THAF1]